MNQKLFYWARLIYQDILYSGLEGEVSKEQRKKILRLNQFVVLALLINFFSVFIYFYHSLYISALINITSAYFFMLAYWFNSRKKLETGRFISVINLNLYLIILSYVEGLKAGTYLFYFPYFLVLTFVVSIGRHFKGWIFAYSVTLISALICLNISPETNSSIQTMTDMIYKKLYTSNLSIAMTLTLTFSYAILRINKDHEDAIMQENINLKKTELELIKAKKKAEVAANAKSRFLSNMSHELRTPLNGIIGASNLLFEENYLPHQKPSLEILKYSSEHMMMLVNDILDYHKIEAGKLELDERPVNIMQFMNRIIKQFSGQVSAKGLNFHTAIDIHLDNEMYTDETRLNQVLSNLLSNAIKFTDTGSISLTAKQLYSTSEKATVQFVVRDTGIGIPENKHREIFRSFTQADIDTTRKFGGTGLGLTISKRLINMFNSELMLKSQEGRGSEFFFTIELKINQDSKLYVHEDNNKQLTSLEGIKILIAEDNKVNMSIAKRFMSKWGIEVAEATNGVEAVEKFRAGKYDLMLIDLEMPEMDGPSALKEIRKLNSDVPAMAFTAAVYDNMENDLLRKGFVDYIHKPFRPEDLHDKIRSLVLENRA
ncbi:MAG: response regulator [Chitinophagaceae bacterium]|nr:response regulator [Chitinophagaceae bacterium]